MPEYLNIKGILVHIRYTDIATLAGRCWGGTSEGCLLQSQKYRLYLDHNLICDSLTESLSLCEIYAFSLHSYVNDRWMTLRHSSTVAVFTRQKFGLRTQGVIIKGIRVPCERQGLKQGLSRPIIKLRAASKRLKNLKKDDVTDQAHLNQTSDYHQWKWVHWLMMLTLLSKTWRSYSMLWVWSIGPLAHGADSAVQNSGKTWRSYSMLWVWCSLIVSPA